MLLINLKILACMSRFKQAIYGELVYDASLAIASVTIGTSSIFSPAEAYLQKS